MNKEKMLYHAKFNGTLRFQSHEYRGNVADNLNFLIDGGFLSWETNYLWKDYADSNQADLYETAFHEYKITKDGEVLLAIYRLEYADKNNRGTEKHLSRVQEFKDVLINSGKDIQYYEPALTKNQKKAVRLALGTESTPVQPTYPVQSTDEIDLSEMSLVSMFNMSTGLGDKGADQTRSNTYVLSKCMEELGEMALEDQIEKGLNYKAPGKDGVKGEAVDLAICAMDMFALQCPGMSSEEIEREFLVYMVKKLNKWRDSLKW